MRRPAAAALTAAAVTAVTAATCAPASAAPVLPVELPPLLIKMKTLSLSSERFTTTFGIHGHKLAKPFAGLRSLTFRVSGEVNLTSPQSGVARATVVGHKTTVRVVGGSVYLDEPAIASEDGGRPWISSTPPKPPSVTGDSPGVAGSGTHPYTGLAQLIEGAKTVRSLGAGTADGQPVARFAVSVDPARLESGLSAKTRAKLRTLHGLRKGRFEVDIDQSGLPVHVSGLIAFGKIALTFSADVLAVNFPLTVTPPPPQETITEAELLSLLRKGKHLK